MKTPPERRCRRGGGSGGGGSGGGGGGGSGWGGGGGGGGCKGGGGGGGGGGCRGGGGGGDGGGGGGVAVSADLEIPVDSLKLCHRLRSGCLLLLVIGDVYCIFYVSSPSVAFYSLQTLSFICNAAFAAN